MEKFLSIAGFGDVHEVHFESGIVLARDYFERHNFDFLECYEAYRINQKPELAQHWIAAEQQANLALYAFNLQDSSILELEVEDEDFY